MKDSERGYDYRRRRQAAGLTRQQAATRLGLDCATLRAIEAGAGRVNARLHARLLTAYRPHAGPLTMTEALVVTGLWRGLGNAEIAAELGMAEKTIKNLLTTIYARLGVQGSGNARVQAATIVWEAARALDGQATAQDEARQDKAA
jgi:DNA-binding CsgD family transcriptional regulator/DNA-binding XRE family transcriptional regulator